MDSTSAALAVHYEPSDSDITRIIPSLLTNCEDFTFIDLGSGKGKAILEASEFAFREIVGVELSPRLVECAKRNVDSFRSSRKRCTNIVFCTTDATTFEFPDGPLVVYLYHPFEVPVIRRVVDNLRLSVVRKPRAIYVIYKRPIAREVFDNTDFLTEVRSGTDYVAWSARFRSGQ